MADIPTSMRKRVRTRSLGVCERCQIAWAIHVHHRQRRREGGHRLSNLVHLCGTCHVSVHDHPESSRADGWIVSVNDDPATTPMKHYTCLRFFDDDGGVRREDGFQRQGPQTDPTRR